MVADDLSFTRDPFDPKAVAKFIHGMLKTAILNDVSTTGFLIVNEEVQRIIDAQLPNLPAADAERDVSLIFIIKYVFPDIVELVRWS